MVKYYDIYQSKETGVYIGDDQYEEIDFLNTVDDKIVGEVKCITERKTVEQDFIDARQAFLFHRVCLNY
jgi:hypothetical protein